MTKVATLLYSFNFVITFVDDHENRFHFAKTLKSLVFEISLKERFNRKFDA